MTNKKKALGQVFTPEWVVELILDRLDYSGKNILDKYVFEPGSGTGNFLLPIVERYVKAAKKAGWSKAKISKGLSKFIYGVEIDDDAYRSSLNRLNLFLKKQNLPAVKWQIANKDILDLNLRRLPKFDFAIGNPPYVRIHNLNKSKLGQIKANYEFTKKGIIDLFLVFFEIGINSLNTKGRLGFITPNSYIHNSTYGPFRKYLADHQLISELIDFKEHIIFNDASTYNAITILDKGHQHNFIDYYHYGKNKQLKLINKIDISGQNIQKWNLTNQKHAKFLSGIKDAKHKISDYANVQYGFATLRDKAYLVDAKTIKEKRLEKALLYLVIKGSRQQKTNQYIIYPYEYKSKSWVVVPEKNLQKKYPNIFKHFQSQKTELKARSLDKGAKWYEYGRSQGVQTIHNSKLIISPVLKNHIKISKAGAKVMMYSGMFLFPKPGSGKSLGFFQKILQSPDFLKYAKMVGKDMRGGYKNINTKAIKDYPVND